MLAALELRSMRPKPLAGQIDALLLATVAGRLAPDQPAARRKQLDAIALRDKAPDALWREQHDRNSQCAEQDQIPGAEVGEISLEQIEHDDSHNRPLNRADATDDH